MSMHLSLLHLIFFLLPPTLSIPLISKEGCRSHCGDLAIPFPFGIGSHCSLDASFNIDCDSSTHPPKPYFSVLNAEIVEINDTYIRVKNLNIVSVCFDEKNATYKHNMSMNLTGTPFELSIYNSVIAIGCDDDMLLVFDERNGRFMLGGCSVSCNSHRGTVGYCTNNSTSVSNGCCHVPFNGVRGINIMEAQLIGRSGQQRLYSCSYAFMMEWRDYFKQNSSFSYPLHYLYNSTTLANDEWASASQAPVLRLDWTITGADNCSHGNNHICGDKSICVDFNYDIGNGKGYLCSCVQGYEGSPYLPHGCQPVSSTAVAKRECQDRCGNISIPFPFGIGKNCYLAPSFNIRCNTSTNPPKAYLDELDAQVIQLEMNPSRIRINYPNMGFACYNGSAKIEEHRLIVDLSRTQYSLSDENAITAIGCHDMLGVFGPDNRSIIGSSCAAFCQYGVSFGLCPGQGCCRIAILRGTTYVEAKLSDLSEVWPRTRFSCSYAFVGSRSSSDGGYSMLFNSSDIPTYFHWKRVAVLLDWRIGAVNCTEAKRDKSSYACKENSKCIDFDATIGGYLCNCSEGYQGNPYIPSGCQDIDECSDNSTSPCVSNAKCNNTNGSFKCLCPNGFGGDGRKDGTGCFQQQQTRIIILIGMSSGLGFLLLLLICCWLYKVFQRTREKKLRSKFFKRNGGLLLQQQTNEGALGKTKVFSVQELEVATDHFNVNRVIGHGGQGTVYKGMLSDGKIVAVKKSKLVEEKQLEQFINEVVILSHISHKNVVRLLGCCLEMEVPLLVYEFMPNGTLSDLLHDRDSEFPLPWSMRLKIAADIAGALAYLHSASSLPIYHRDIKSDNILLDEKYVVKLSDFGISRSVVADQTHLTTLVKGTFGYFDPEYFQSSHYTEKSDVYSFGVVLVELLTRQRPISLNRTDEERGLAPRFRTSMDENCLDTILDPQILQQDTDEEVIMIAKLAHRCLNLKGIMRPTMKEVGNELERRRISQMPSIAEDENEEVRIVEDINTVSDIEDTWSSNYSTSSSERLPLTLTKETKTTI